MKRFWMVVFMVVVGTAFCLDYAVAKKPGGKDKDKINAVSRLAHAGDIKGSVDCSNQAKASADGYLVYIPGTSFLARTDIDGNFRLYNVPAGSYDLYIEPANQLAPVTPTIDSNVEVPSKAVVDLGSYDVCLP